MLPASLLTFVEQHPCFSGCWTVGHRAQCVLDPAAPLEPIVEVHCADCLVSYVACRQSLLPAGTDADGLARGLTAHVRAHRGFALSFGGYHGVGGGFWLSAAYWAGSGVFVLGCDRAGTAGRARVDSLVRAFAVGVAQPLHAAMTDPKEYRTVDVHLTVVPPPVAMSVPALLASTHVSASGRADTRAVTLAEFLPVAATAQAALALGGPPSLVAHPAASAAARTVPRALVAGERCEACGHLAEERLLLTSSYVACRCPG